MEKDNHPLHKYIAKIVSAEFKDSKISCDSECYVRKIDKNLNSLCYEKDREKSEFSQADMIILKDNKIKVIIEIEDSNVTPNQACGKVLAAALARYCFPKRGEAHKGISNSVLFIQVLNKDKMKSKGNKKHQLKLLEKAIDDKIKFSKIKEYKLYSFSTKDHCHKMIKEIREFLK